MSDKDQFSRYLGINTVSCQVMHVNNVKCIFNLMKNLLKLYFLLNFCENQLTGFYMMGTLVVKGLIKHETKFNRKVFYKEQNMKIDFQSFNVHGRQ